ncbi:hypothetical protein ILUMI_23286 [Ignelater luminosus]|uniref:BZIP domain-containing protein n=1 Tax=Ignelater luminosus TaxID=2038154 RepID=A0A8K0FX04_IGNLU|nr:hypothetical protein ILUMI_23286 [Ignelater luminosus]
MSRMMYSDYMEQNVEDFEAIDPLAQLKKDLDAIEFPSNLSFENPALMSSEFFDSVLSMEQSNFGCELDKEPLSNVDSDFGFSDADDMRLNNNCSPDSGSSSIDYEFKDFGMEYKTNNDLVLNFINQAEEDNTKNNTPTVQVPTKVFISNPNGKKVIVKPYTSKNNRKNITNTKQVLRVQSISGGGRSVLLPFNVAKMKNIKIINGKEIQAENLKITKITDLPPARKPCITSMRKTYIDNYEASSPETFDDDSDSVDAKSDHDRQYPILVLTEEEKRLLNKEGICLPTHYPLTKQQERELKRIRRKIRNKISAQDSRKRKKEYVDGLEERIKQGAEEKKILMNRVKHLQQQNSRLIAQMNKLQALVFNTSGSKATPTTCLLIVLVSALLVSLPNLRVPQNSEWKDQQQSTARRALLSSQQATNEDTVNMEEFLLFNRDDESELKNTMFDEDNNTEDFGISKYIHSYDKYENTGQNYLGKDNAKTLEPHDLDRDVRDTYAKVRNFFQQEFDSLRFDYDSYGKLNNKYQSEKKFIEPDIDDGGPDIIHECSPAKRMKVVDANDNIIFNNCIPKSDSASNVVSATVAVNSSRKE